MSLKVLRDSNGAAVAFGPNNAGYQPAVPPGYSLQVEETEPQLPPQSKEQRVTARAQSVGYATKGHLINAIESARFIAAAKLGITEEQAHALGLQNNTMYQAAWGAWQDIVAIEAEQ